MAAARCTRTWSVGDRTVTLSVPAIAAGVHVIELEWSPDVPTAASLSSAERLQYVSGRNEALAEIAQELGVAAGGAMVIDV